jgi:hypothetical protein
MRARSVSSRASRSLAAAATTSRTSRSSTVTSTFQIPNDVPTANRPIPTTTKRKPDTFLAVQFHHAIGDTGAITWGPAINRRGFKTSAIRTNDFIYGESLNVRRRPRTATAARRRTAPTRSSSVRTNPTGFPTMCAYSLADQRGPRSTTSCRPTTRRTSASIRSRGRKLLRSRADLEILRDHAAAQQLSRTDSHAGNSPNAPATVIDDSPNLGNTYQVVHSGQLAHEQLSGKPTMACATTSLRSLDLVLSRASALSAPRFKLTRFFGTRASVYAYIGRFFEPFSLENVSPEAAYLLNLPLQPTEAQFDLKPERDTQLELGGHIATRFRRSWLSRVAEECQRPHRRHPGRRHAAASGHQLRAGPAFAGGAQLRSKPLPRKMDVPISDCSRGLAQ